MLTGSIELWISLPERAKLPKGWEQRAFKGGQRLRFEVRLLQGRGCSSRTAEL